MIPVHQFRFSVPGSCGVDTSELKAAITTRLIAVGRKWLSTAQVLASSWS